MRIRNGQESRAAAIRIRGVGRIAAVREAAEYSRALFIGCRHPRGISGITLYDYRIICY